MCELCGRLRCLPRCPNYAEQSSIRCRECGYMLMPGDGYYRINGKPYCEECVEHAGFEDLLRICEADREEVIDRLGMKHIYFDSGKE